MIQISDLFCMMGQGDCFDVASSMAMQGCVTDMEIPIYEIFYLKIMFGDKCGFLASDLNEFAALKKLANDCGSVTVTINILNMDVLSLVGAVCVGTPNTGPHVFLKECISDLTQLAEEAEDMIVQMAGLGGGMPGMPGMPIVPGTGGTAVTRELLNRAVDILFEQLVTSLQHNCQTYGIQVHHWMELADYFNELEATGELAEMRKLRMQVGGFVF